MTIGVMQAIQAGCNDGGLMLGKHNFWRTPAAEARETYNSWRDMHYRCYNTSNNGYSTYGGRGIEVCERWYDNFDAFMEDMGLRPVEKTLERIDVNRNYDPFNCVWANRDEQSRNKRSNIYHSSERIIETDLAASAGINLTTFRSRIAAGHSVQSALTNPVRQKSSQSPHGTRSRYRGQRCRCNLCKEANTDYAKQQRARRRG